MYILDHFDQNIFDIHFRSVESLHQKNSNITFLLIRDYNLVSANFSNAVSYFNNKLSYLNFFQLDNIKIIIRIVTLDLVFSNSYLINIEIISSPIVPIDPLPPPININYKVSQNEK